MRLSEPLKYEDCKEPGFYLCEWYNPFSGRHIDFIWWDDYDKEYMAGCSSCQYGEINKEDIIEIRKVEPNDS